MVGITTQRKTQRPLPPPPTALSIQALSTGISYYYVSNGNSIGYMCDFIDRFEIETSPTTIR